MHKQFVLPCIEALLFVATIYLEKFVRKRLLKRKNWKSYTRIIFIAIITILLMQFTYQYECQYSFLRLITFFDCFYLSIVPIQIMHIVVANTILFGFHIYERSQDKTLFMAIEGWPKKIIFAPLLQQLLFRGVFYRSAGQNPNIWILALIFSVSHLHKSIWKAIQDKPVFWKRSIFQVCFTYVFAYYGFFFLDLFKSLVPSIILHCYCNYLGPPKINSRNLKYHIMCIILFFLYVHFII